MHGLRTACKYDRFCPACRQSTTYIFLYCKNGCDIFQCTACGLGAADVTDFDPAAYYTNSYFTGGQCDGYANYLATERVLSREFDRELQFIRRYRDSGKLIEIGCAYGFFLEQAKRYFDVAGIELAQAAAAHCRKRGLNVVSGDVNENNLSTIGKSEVIVMLDLLEHLRNPFEVLSLCVRHLNPRGVIVLTTGDFGSRLARWVGASWRLMTPPQHQWFFTALSIRRIAANMGLTVESIDYPWKIVPLSLILFQLRRKMNRAAATATASRIAVPVNLFDAMRVVLRAAG